MRDGVWRVDVEITRDPVTGRRRRVSRTIQEPIGLDDDYALVKPANADGYVGWLDTLLETSLGHSGAHRVQVRVEIIVGRDVCRLDVPASSRPIRAKGKDGDVLYERRNNSTRVVPAAEVDAFITGRFGTKA